ncbi:MAG: hypothetical protein HRK26_05535 [Rickettsiaceae bacterium H1]|nr:hypothetical protein [Rickettsiaceae bacterium H1]
MESAKQSIQEAGSKAAQNVKSGLESTKQGIQEAGSKAAQNIKSGVANAKKPLQLLQNKKQIQGLEKEKKSLQKDQMKNAKRIGRLESTLTGETYNIDKNQLKDLAQKDNREEKINEIAGDNKALKKGLEKYTQLADKGSDLKDQIENKKNKIDNLQEKRSEIKGKSNEKQITSSKKIGEKNISSDLQKEAKSLGSGLQGVTNDTKGAGKSSKSPAPTPQQSSPTKAGRGM